LRKSEEFHIEQTMLDDKLKATDWEATNEEIMELVARESYLQWLKDNEKRNTLRTNDLNLIQTNEINASCSTWDFQQTSFNNSVSCFSDKSPMQINNSNNNVNNNNRLSPSKQTTNNISINNANLRTSRRLSASTPPQSPSQSKTTNLKSSPQLKANNENNNSNKKNQIQPSYHGQYDYYLSNSPKGKSSGVGSGSNAGSRHNTAINELVENNIVMYDENTRLNVNYHKQHEYYESKSIMNELSPDLFGFNSSDWVDLDNENGNDSDILARVLAASQQEYLESLKAKRQQQN
jgi:hypothetical protein